jgi:hypothetical protein
MKDALPRPFVIECRVNRDEWARLDVLASQLGVSRWRVMRLALHLLFAEHERANEASATSPLDELRQTSRAMEVAA